MGRFVISTFLVRYLLPVLASAIAAPVVLATRMWPAIRLTVLVCAAGCIALMVISAVAQGY